MEANTSTENQAGANDARALEILEQLAKSTQASVPLMADAAAMLKRADAQLAAAEAVDKPTPTQVAEAMEVQQKKEAKERARRAEEDAREEETRKKMGIPTLGKTFYQQFDGAIGCDLSAGDYLRAKTAGLSGDYCGKLNTIFGAELAQPPSLETKPELHAILAFADGTKMRDHGSVVRIEREGPATPQQRAKHAFELASAKGWTKREPWFSGSDEFVKACFYESITQGVPIKVFDNQKHLMEIAKTEADAAGVKPPEKSTVATAQEAPLEADSKDFAAANKASKPVSTKPASGAQKTGYSAGQRSGNGSAAPRGGWGGKKS